MGRNNGIFVHMNIQRGLLLFSFIIGFFLSHSSLGALTVSELKMMADSDFPLRETVEKNSDDLYEMTLLPDAPGSSQLRDRFQEYGPELLVQKLYRIRIPNVVSTRVLFTQVVNILGTPETQKGYTYHSSTRDEDTVLFKDSYISTKKGKRDTSFTYDTHTLPFKIEYYQFVNEANFSGTVMKQTITIADTHLLFSSTNIERIWYMIIPILKSEGTRSDMLFFVDDSYLYIYSSTQVREDPSTRLPISPHLPSLFGKRMDVLAQWMEDQLRMKIK